MGRAVVPIRSLGTRLPDAGRIRIGTSEPTTSARGKTFDRPVKLDRFRFTSSDSTALEQVAAIYGGQVRPWQHKGAAAGQFELLSDAREIRIALPPDPLGNTPIYELWEGGGCQRRCDGETCEMLVQGPDGLDLQQVPCLCAARGELACKVTTRLSVLLPEIRFVGVWRLDTHGWHAAHELPGMVELIRQLQDRGIVRGLLRVEARTQVVAGRTREFVVPVLGVDESVEALAAGAGRVTALSSVSAVAELEAGPAGGGVSASATSGADDDVVDAELVDSPAVPEDACVTCGRSVRDGTPVVRRGGQRHHKACIADPGPAMRRLFALLAQHGIDDGRRHAWASDRLGRQVQSFSDLSPGEIETLIDVLEPVG